MDSLYTGSGILFDKELKIPELEKEQIIELYNKIKPIITIDGVSYFLRNFNINELECGSYTWHREEDKRTIIRKDRLLMIRDFLCLHQFDCKYFFKPTIVEVLAQIPEELVDEINAFEIIEEPKEITDLSKYQEITDNGFHLSKVRTYKITK